MTDRYLDNVLVGFGPNTKITTFFDGPKLFKDIKLNDTLMDDSYVIGVLKFKNNGKIYKFKNDIYLHENLKYENIKIKDHPDAILTTHSPEFIYNIITDNGCIKIKDILFDDFTSCTNKFYNYTINSIILSFLNKNIDLIDNVYGGKYLAHGFSYNTMVSVSANLQKKMGDIQINDIISYDNSVLGTVKLSPDFFTYYKYNNTIISSNTKIYVDGLWKSVEYNNCRRMPPQLELINIITKKGLLLCDKEIFMDFLEVRSEFIKKRIDEIKNASKLDSLNN